MEWSRGQQQALDAVGNWLCNRDKPWFFLGGYAGTGKTTLARHLAEGVDGLVLFSAYTGKAALVMRKAGCENASTIHSLIYWPKTKGRARLWELESKLNALREDADGHDVFPDEVTRLELELQAEKKRLRRPSFRLNEESDLLGASLLVIDECSMVGEDMAQDLLSFEVPILVLGDPAQLPPVRGTGYFTNAKPDAMLTEIHRQAADNPIIQMATLVREGRCLEYGRYGASAVLHVNEFDRDAVDPDQTQVIVGRNETRRRANKRIRRNYIGEKAEEYMVYSKDKLVCLRNDKETGLLNGGLWRVISASGDLYWQTEGLAELEIEDEDDPDRVLEVVSHTHHFLGPKEAEELLDNYWIRKTAQEFDYGYALTCHKSQGSQWEDVVVVDEAGVFKQFGADQPRRWTYTALTRASEKVTVVR